MRIFNKSFLFWLAVLCLSIFIVSGCGRKKPPLPPNIVQPHAVRDLSININGDNLELNWTMNEKKDSSLTGYIVYRSKKQVSEDNCENCPVLFERIADLPVEGGKGRHIKGNVFTYRETLEKGYRYAYKVAGYTYSGITD
ncbi:MAG: hypothetical protein HN379_07190, partial [Desulfobacteraceae bacterium]|nr:hypothetical protein [Desulfobacteraceae bacterium]